MYRKNLDSKKKKLTGILALTAASCLALGACSGSGSGASSAPPPTGSSGAAAGMQKAGVSSAAAGSDILNEAGTYPIVKEPVRMSMFRMSAPNVVDFATNDFTKYMEELTGIAWEFQTASSEASTEKINLLMASGDYPDVFMFSTPSRSKFGVKEQILIPLEGMIEANMPNYSAYLKEKPELLGRTTETDGHVYGLASVNDCYHCMYRNKMWINTMWLEKMGMEVPTTTDEMLAVCKKFLEINPTGVAISGSTDGWGQQAEDFLTNSFIFDPGVQSGGLKNTTKIVLNPEGKVVSIADKEEYRDALRYMNELYKAGAIYDGTFTQNSEQFRTLMNQPGEPVLFAPYGTISDGIDSASNPETYGHYQAMAPLKGPAGKQYAPYFKHDGVAEGKFVITDKCQYPEAALRWADYFYTMEGYLSMQFGPDEGKDWVLNPEGKTGLDGGPALYDILNTYSSEPQNHDWQDVGINFATAEIRMGQATDSNVDVKAPEGLEKLLFEATKQQMEPYGQKGNAGGDYDDLPPLHLTAEETTDIQTITVEIEKYIKENRVAFITGTKNVESDWQSYVDGFNNLGMPHFLEVCQNAYDRQFSGN